LLATEVRSGLVETVHEGAFAAFDSNLELLAFSGDIDKPFFLRSSAKPFQAVVSQEFGAALTPLELALAAASHDGFPAHIAIVESMLAKGGLGADRLQCPPLWPLSIQARDILVASGHSEPRRLWHDCSGKHAGWLRACLASGLATETYLDPNHPIQSRIRELVSEVGDLPVDPVGIDGCGAPVLRTTVRAMARMYAVLATDSRFADIYTAMHQYPALVSGVGNGDAVIATSLDAISKRGARGCIGVGVKSQMGLAAKVWDGDDGVAAQAVASGLGALMSLSSTVASSLRGVTQKLVYGGESCVGSFVSHLELTRP
jgi:L-asparaginase II